MYFIPRSNTFYSYIAPIKSRHRYFLIIGLVSLLFSAWLYGVYFRLERTIQRYQYEIAQLRKQATQATCLTQTCQQLEKDIDGLQAQLQPHVSGENDAGLLQSRMLFLINQTKQSGLHLSTCKVENPINKQWYTKQAMHVDLVGTLDQIKHFFDAVNKSASNNSLQCNRINIHKTQRDLFSLSCDVHMIILKEKETPST